MVKYATWILMGRYDLRLPGSMRLGNVLPFGGFYRSTVTGKVDLLYGLCQAYLVCTRKSIFCCN
jgi:hypothetical protein